MPDETLGRMFWSRVERSGGRPAHMIKTAGQWHALTWTEAGKIVRELALGLLALGRGPGEAIALLCRSRAEWVQADFAIMSAGCVTVPIYPTYTPEQIAYLVNDAEARTLFVEDPAQLVKAIEARPGMPALERIVVIQGSVGRDPWVLTWEGLRRLGREHEDALNIAPQVIENLLRGDPLVSQAMLYGDRRPYPVALVSVDREALVRFARARGLLATDYAQLTRNPEVLDQVQRIVDDKNAQLPSYARIKKVAILPADLSEETGELTPTQKIKRKLVADKYADLLESLFERPAAEAGSRGR